MGAIGAHAAAALPGPGASASAPSRLQVTGPQVAGLERSGDPLTDRVQAAFAADPLRHRTLEGAADAVSASITFIPAFGTAQRPVPGSTVPIHADNSLARFDHAAVRAMTVADVLARSQSTLADAMRQATPEGAMGVLDGAGMGIEVKLTQVRERQEQLVAAARLARGTAGELPLLKEANRAALEVLLLQREQEKKEALRRLLFALMCGVVPRALIARMIELGMAGIVEQAIDMVARSGRGISREMSRALHGLQELGLNIHVLPEHLTVDAEADEDARLAALAVVGRDGRLVDALGRTVGVGSNDAAAAAAFVVAARQPA